MSHMKHFPRRCVVFALARAKGRMATLSDETCFGDLFKRFAPFLKMYVEYCTQHENTASRVSLIASKNDKFSNLLDVSCRMLLVF